MTDWAVGPLTENDLNAEWYVNSCWVNGSEGHFVCAKDSTVKGCPDKEIFPFLRDEKVAERIVEDHNAAIDAKVQPNYVAEVIEIDEDGVVHRPNVPESPTTRLVIARLEIKVGLPGYGYYAIKRSIDKLGANICPTTFESIPMFANCRLAPGEGPITVELSGATNGVFVRVEVAKESSTGVAAHG